jgi:hypothetical protein
MTGRAVQPVIRFAIVGMGRNAIRKISCSSRLKLSGVFHPAGAPFHNQVVLAVQEHG